MQKASRTTRIGVLAYPGAQAAAVFGLVDLLEAASRIHVARGAGGPALETLVLRVDGPDEVPPVPAPPLAALVLPPSLEDVSGFARLGPLAAWLAARHRQGTVLCSVCAGAFLLARTGLLSGRPATTHWALAGTFAERFPDVEVLILRFAPIVGPGSNNPFTRLVRAQAVPTVLGFDPLWQVVHEDDAGRALHLALHTRARGDFNIVGEGEAPVSSLLRAAGVTPVPLAGPLLRTAIAAMEAVGLSVSPWALMDFFRYAWLADGRRAARDLHFLPHLPVHEAMATMTARRG